MSGITIKTNLKDIQKRFGVKSKKQFMKITSEAINQTAAHVVNVQRNQIFKKLDRPKPFTVKAVVMSKFAKPTRANLSAQIVVKDKTASYLHYAYTGKNEYPQEGSAKASPVGEGWKRRDKFGNILVRKRGLKATLNETPNSRKNMKGSRFIGKPGGSGTFGVWERQGKKGRDGLELLVAFNPFIKHRKLLSWTKLNVKATKNNMYKKFNQEWQKRIKRKGAM